MKRHKKICKIKGYFMAVSRCNKIEIMHSYAFWKT